MNNLLAKAQKIKRNYHEATSSARSLSSKIQSGDEAWAWANNNGNLGALTKALGGLQESLSDFDKEMLITEVKNIRQKYGQAHLIVDLEAFANLEAKVLLVSQGHKQLMARHTAGAGVLK